MPHRTRLDAGLVIAYQRGTHTVLPGGVVVLEDDRIVHVGREADGPVDETIDLRNRLLTPGFINTHTHLAGSPLDKSLLEDIGKRQFQYSALPDMLPARAAANDRPMMEACVDYSLVELLRTGTTTVMEIGSIGDYVADAAECTGLRAYVADSYRSGRWLSDDGRSVKYEWDEAQGVRDFERALALIERLRDRADGRELIPIATQPDPGLRLRPSAPWVKPALRLASSSLGAGANARGSMARSHSLPWPTAPEPPKSMAPSGRWHARREHTQPIRRWPALP